MKWPRRDTFALSGWLFADLLLALGVLFMVSSGFTAPRPTPTSSPTPTMTPSPSPTVRPTPTPSPTPSPAGAVVGLASICRTANVSVFGLLSDGPVHAAAVDDAIQALSTAVVDLRARPVSLVLTFATASDENTAGDLAHAVNGVLKSAAMRERVGDMFGQAQARSYIFKNADPALQGKIYLELFFPPDLPASTKSDQGCPR